jgi:DNA polymerase-3 subunit gamma/tau
MTYQVLARKWRPKSFSDMAGQEHVLQTLIHALDNNRLHHAYLFTGTRGVGKTTIARIFAKCLNCEAGVSSVPCGTCSACQEIAEGRFIDLIEVDAASKTKVEDTRELLENVQYAPSRGRYKVYLIDEVHMLSTHSFNALLKTLEEPPPHVIFLLATTDPHKLPITILSRCLQFSLKNLTPQKIVDYVRSVLIAEQIEFEESALWHIARAAQGSMRDALTLIDQSISFCGGNITEVEVSSLLGTPDQAILFKIIDAVHKANAAELLDIAALIASRAFDYGILLENFLSLLHRIAVAQLIPAAVDNSQGDREQVIQIAKDNTAENIQLYYQIALKGRQDIGISHDQRMAFEMLLLRMLAFIPQLPRETSQLLENISHDESIAIEEKKKTEDQLAEDISPKHNAEEYNLSSMPVENIEVWLSIIANSNLGGITGNLLANCVPELFESDHLYLVLDETQSSLFNQEHAERIKLSLSATIGKKINLSIRVGELPAESPAMISQRIRMERIKLAIQNFESDEFVQTLISKFSAKIITDSITVINEDMS